MHYFLLWHKKLRRPDWAILQHEHSLIKNEEQIFHSVQHWNKWNDTRLSSSIETGLFRLMSCLPEEISPEMSVD